MNVASDRSNGGPAHAAHTRIMLRPIGSPLPLGLLAIMVGGILLACLQVGAFPPKDQRTIALLILAFTVPLELLATIFCFLARDTVAATGLGIFSGAWLASGVALLSAPPGQTDKAFGVFMLCLAAALLAIVAGASPPASAAAIVGSCWRRSRCTRRSRPRSRT